MRTFHNAVGKIEAVAAAILLMMMVLLIFSGGIARLLAHPLNWTIDFATCFFAWACFLCADIAWRRDGLMSIDILIQHLPLAVQKALVTVNHLLISAFLMYVIYAGTWLSWISRARSFQGIPSISYSWITMSLPVGATLLLITTLLKLLDHFRARQPPLSAAVM
ncbi:TRAP transporter small permease subunit [Mesorhizobium sp. WSM2239]|uniref:TRAP transporter small permease protein n=2 Tax=unclassified Mesorhizobium TaxID=325217 RepID=A0AAU8DJE3_9HYPH